MEFKLVFLFLNALSIICTKANRLGKRVITGKLKIMKSTLTYTKKGNKYKKFIKRLLIHITLSN